MLTGGTKSRNACLPSATSALPSLVTCYLLHLVLTVTYRQLRTKSVNRRTTGTGSTCTEQCTRTYILSAKNRRLRPKPTLLSFHFHIFHFSSTRSCFFNESFFLCEIPLPGVLCGIYICIYTYHIYICTVSTFRRNSARAVRRELRRKVGGFLLLRIRNAMRSNERNLFF